MSRRRRPLEASGLHGRLVADRVAFLERVEAAVDGYDGERTAVPLPGARPDPRAPLSVLGWHLPDEVRRSIGVAVHARLLVDVDDVVSVDEEIGWTPSVVEDV